MYGLVNLEKKKSCYESVVVKKQAQWRAVIGSLPQESKV